jgi:patatin-related protein
MSQPAPDDDRFDTEIRFAIVMYGGVSLAVYMNGIAQELLHMVRATTPKGDPLNGQFRYRPEELTGTERVYRELAGKLRARFVVDIISGTSAGGINGIFLAKALAQGQSLDQLRNLWVTEGDAGRLLNDKASLKGGLPPELYEKSPSSLLNGQRFYWELLDALEGMEPPAGKGKAADVDEIDLFVTATDFYGLPAPLILSDKEVDEPIHRKTFHFRFWQPGGQAAKRDDFGRDLNPILAFAARCTASFPAAFAPFKLKDIDPALENHSAYQGARGKLLGSGNPKWGDFFEGYPQDYADRYFVDGGYLDNKPFDLALRALSSRHHVLLPNERVLLYIEPDPERSGGHTKTERPDVVAALLAVDSLPRSEPIRSEVDEIAARNLVYERASLLTAGIEEDVAKLGGERETGVAATDWAKQDLAGLIKERGLAYGGYHRLKIARINDWLADCLRAAPCTPALPLATLRELVRQWREATYVRYRDGERLTENRLLIDLDVAYRLRRIEMVRIKLSEILCSPESAHEIFALGRIKSASERMDGWEETRPKLLELQRRLQEVHQRLISLNEDCQKLVALTPAMGTASAAFTTAPNAEAATALLRTMADGVAARLTAISEACRAVLAPGAEKPESYLETARHTLRHFFTHYDDFDLVGFPMLYCLGTDELRQVSVSRVSAADTTLGGEVKAEKLAGVKLGHFGAFLDPDWRAHDILWGRLDGAERIIAALTAAAAPEIRDKRADFMDAAFIAVTSEVQGPAMPPPTSRKEIEERVKSLTTNEALAPATTLDLLGRSTSIVRRLLGNVAEQRGLEKNIVVAWTLRLLAVIWGVVELAIPKSLSQILFGYWLQLAMLSGGLLAGIGFAFDLSAEKRIGGLLIVAAAAASLAGLALREVVERKERRALAWWPALAAASLGAVLILELGPKAAAHLPSGDAMIDLELAGTSARLTHVLVGCSADCVEKVVHAITWDLVVITGYLLLLGGLSFVSRAWLRWARWPRGESLARGVGLAVGVAAAADVLENAGMWLSLRLTDTGMWPWLADARWRPAVSAGRAFLLRLVPLLTFGFSTLKWGLLFVSAAFNVCTAAFGIGLFVARRLGRLRALFAEKAVVLAQEEPKPAPALPS